ncbi:hypothetical protein J6590_079891 [Homalodisca vitripennis]|nr:hypothetical protein J6590_079891 [Homalodisca vitripennis]
MRMRMSSSDVPDLKYSASNWMQYLPGEPGVVMLQKLSGRRTAPCHGHSYGTTTRGTEEDETEKQDGMWNL